MLHLNRLVFHLKKRAESTLEPFISLFVLQIGTDFFMQHNFISVNILIIKSKQRSREYWVMKADFSVFTGMYDDRLISSLFKIQVIIIIIIIIKAY